MTDYDIIARAQMYLEKMIGGIDPLTGKEIPEGELIRNPRISRCLDYTSVILKQILKSGVYKVTLPERAPFSLTAEQRERFEYSEAPLSISEITKRLNDLIEPLYTSELRNGIITEWLMRKGFLTEITVNDKTRKAPTEAGERIGIASVLRQTAQGRYYHAIIYNIDAQRFIVDNIDAITASLKEETAQED